MFAAEGTGEGFTVTDVVAVAEHVPTETVTEYTPLITVVEPGMDGFCSAEEKPFGPLQL